MMYLLRRFGKTNEVHTLAISSGKLVTGVKQEDGGRWCQASWKKRRVGVGGGGVVRKYKRDESSAAERIRDRRERYVN